MIAWITFFFLIAVGAVVLSEYDRMTKRAHRVLDGLELSLQRHRDGEADDGDLALRVARTSGALDRVRLETVAEIEAAYQAIETGAEDREDAVNKALAGIVEARKALTNLGLG